MTKINFAIIGCGRIAQRHAEHISNLGNLVAVCDIIPQKATELATKYNVNYYTAIDDLLTVETSIDVVVICTPNGLHASHAIKALQAAFCIYKGTGGLGKGCNRQQHIAKAHVGLERAQRDDHLGSVQGSFGLGTCR